jgi:hypothetical protein
MNVLAERITPLFNSIPIPLVVLPGVEPIKLIMASEPVLVIFEGVIALLTTPLVFESVLHAVPFTVIIPLDVFKLLK